MGYQPTGPGERRPVSRRCAVTAHGPVQPVWNCGGCGLPWPCPTRKQELRAQFAGAPVSLALYLGSYLVQAAEDMPGHRPARYTTALSAGPDAYRRYSSEVQQPCQPNRTEMHLSRPTQPGSPNPSG
ncbi:hypothetical protein Sar04_20950 [Salinispora arenicola]|uniref:Flavin reductase n=1 Tax=Salinispora arenicola TaxID=168697 RepID=A0ABQ4JU39_SALAC|nr:hypothetical protein Sar04_20950 [Salinispora arenicola]